MSVAMKRYAWLLAAALLTTTIAAQCERGWTVARAADEWTLFTWAEGEPAVWVPAAWAEWAPDIIRCESEGDSGKVGSAGERGLLQLHPVHDDGMRAAGLDPEREADRLQWAVSLWGWSGETWRRHWRHCARLVGAP